MRKLIKHIGYLWLFLVFIASAPLLHAGKGNVTEGTLDKNFDISKLNLVDPPDLIFASDTTARQWVVRDEYIDANSCDAIEGGINGGEHRILRFSTASPNIGKGDLYIGDPNAHYNAGDGLFILATCHGHFHFNNYAIYELIDGNGQVWKSAKQGFCMLDVIPNTATGYGGTPPKSKNFNLCGHPATATEPEEVGNQGITHGWADEYYFKLPGQYFVLDGGDNQPVIPPGNYFIRLTVNPAYPPKADGTCQFPGTEEKNQSGKVIACHNFKESNYANNVTIVPVTIPSHPGRSGNGPQANSGPGIQNSDEHGLQLH